MASDPGVLWCEDTPRCARGVQGVCSVIFTSR